MSQIGNRFRHPGRPVTGAGEGNGRSLWAGFLGFALGGFFDGILLHQILQRHHLLSLVPGMADLRLQVLWDGYFHALMYGLAALSLWGLWRSRHAALPTRRMLGLLLFGFGAWHVTDGIVSHWLLGLHRVRMDAALPLAWDLGWAAGFGLLPVWAGWRLARGAGGGGPTSRAALAALMAATLGAGAWAARPPLDQPFVTVVFGTGIAPEPAIRAAGLADADLIWIDPSSAVAVIRPHSGNPWRLYRNGAILVSGAGVPAGCFNWAWA